jgi:hypothetical protein
VAGLPGVSFLHSALPNRSLSLVPSHGLIGRDHGVAQLLGFSSGSRQCEVLDGDHPLVTKMLSSVFVSIAMSSCCMPRFDSVNDLAHVRGPFVEGVQDFGPRSSL